MTIVENKSVPRACSSGIPLFFTLFVDDTREGRSRHKKRMTDRFVSRGEWNRKNKNQKQNWIEPKRYRGEKGLVDFSGRKSETFVGCSNVSDFNAHPSRHQRQPGNRSRCPR